MEKVVLCLGQKLFFKFVFFGGGALKIAQIMFALFPSLSDGGIKRKKIYMIYFFL
jgi:hypothetical protein